MKQVEILPYSDAHKKGVVECLQRNYEWMGQRTVESIMEWLSPVTDYEWSEDAPSLHDENPYRKGAVLVADDDTVVGYLGLITSKRSSDNGKAVVYGQPTTWAIDEEYRFYLLKAMKLLISSADVVYDFTARKSIEDTFKRIFKFDVSDNNSYLLYPIPCAGDNVAIKWFSCVDEIEEEELKKIYVDHSNFYGIRLLVYKDVKSGEKGYLFYKVYDENSARIRVLMIVNVDLFVAESHEIIWKILKHEFYEHVGEDELLCRIMQNLSEGKMICAECNKMLLRGQKINYPVMKERKGVMICNREGLVNDYMYTEIAMLPNMI